MEGEIQIIDNRNENSLKEVQSEVDATSGIIVAVSIAIILNIITALFYYFFQGIDAGCGAKCESFVFVIVVIIYYISVLRSVYLIKKNPISVGMYIFTASLASLALNNIIFGIIPFIMLFVLGAKILEENWKRVEGSEKTKQILIGLMFSMLAVLLSAFHFIMHLA